MNKVKIGGIVYEIEKVNDLAIKDDVIGRIKYYEAKIELEKVLSKQVEEQTLVHEILHGCFKEAGYNEQDEDVIDRVGKVLYQVLKDNDFSFLRDNEITPELLKELSNQRMVIFDGQEIANSTGKRLVAD